MVKSRATNRRQFRPGSSINRSSKGSLQQSNATLLRLQVLHRGSDAVVPVGAGPVGDVFALAILSPTLSPARTLNWLNLAKAALIPSGVT